MLAHGTSEDFPPYFKIKQLPINKSQKVLNSGAKKCFPDKTGGVSEEFPTYFRQKHQLISAYSRPNPYMDENFIKKSINEYKVQQIQKFLSPQ